VIVGDAYVFGYNAGTFRSLHAGTIKVDPLTKTVDLVIKAGLDKRGTLPGLFDLSENTLKLALPNSSLVRDGKTTNRPATLQPGPETRHLLYTFMRDTTVTREQAKGKLKEMRKAAGSDEE